MGSSFSRQSKRRSDEMVSLEDYKKPVDRHSAAIDNAAAEVTRETFSLGGLGLRILTLKRDSGGSSSVFHRKLRDARMVTFRSMPLSCCASVSVKEPPLDTELHEKIKECDPRLDALAFRAKQKKVFGFQTDEEVTRMREGKPKDGHEKLFHPLKIEEDEEVSHALYGGYSHEILVTHKPSNIEISRKVLQCLRPGAWLNDEVINLYLELLKERERSEPNKFLKCHFFNTFFYQKLTSGKRGYDYNAVRRWTTKKKLGYTLIECDKIFVPIHEDVHWCLAVINIKDKSFQYLDSLGGMDIHVLNLLAAYLMEEIQDKCGKEIDTFSWTHQPANGLPLQENTSDCGMFMIKYTDFCSRGLKPFFKQEHMACFRERTAFEILKLRAE